MFCCPAVEQLTIGGYSIHHYRYCTTFLKDILSVFTSVVQSLLVVGSKLKTKALKLKKETSVSQHTLS